VAITSLPYLTEQRFCQYLNANFSGTYTTSFSDPITGEPGQATFNYLVLPTISTGNLSFPAVIVHAGKFTELSPGTDVFNGSLTVQVISLVDDVANPIDTHEGIVSEIYELLRDVSTVQSGVNGIGCFHLWEFYNDGYELTVGTSEKERCFVSTLDFKLAAQTLAVP